MSGNPTVLSNVCVGYSHRYSHRRDHGICNGSGVSCSAVEQALTSSKTLQVYQVRCARPLGADCLGFQEAGGALCRGRRKGRRRWTGARRSPTPPPGHTQSTCTSHAGDCKVHQLENQTLSNRQQLVPSFKKSIRAVLF